MKFPDTLEPYAIVDRSDIVYSVCRDFDHISRYKGLRQVIHEGDKPARYIALETVNSVQSSVPVNYYTVTKQMENRLDLISYKFLGSPTYAWVIAYVNDIADGFTCPEGMSLAIPTSISSLFGAGELLAAVSAMKLNLGSE